MAHTLAPPLDNTTRAESRPAGSRHLLSRASLTQRMVPVWGSAAFVLLAVNYALWWDPVVHHVDAWWVPGDFWINYFGTSAFLHGHWVAMYALHGGLDTPPGLFVALTPAVALAQALHLSVGMPYTAVSTPTTWLVLEPFALLSGSAALFSIDAVARRLAVPVLRRAILAVVEVFALWDVLVNQWHPEDVVAVALALWALLAVFDGRWRRSAWLLGVAIAFQPLVVLALAAVLALAPRRSRVGLLVRAAVPGAVVIAGPFIAGPRNVLRAVVAQPGYPLLNHRTPWTAFAPHIGHGAVAAGPVRLVAVVVAVLVSWFVCRHTRRVELVVWTVALCFATRSVFESVMISYYIWSTLAVALIVAARATRARFATVCVLSSFATSFALRDWRGAWAWWSILVACIGIVLVAAWPTRGPAAPDGSQRQTTPADRAPLDGTLQPLSL